MIGEHKTEYIDNIIYPKKFFRDWMQQADALAKNPDWRGHRTSSLDFMRDMIADSVKLMKDYRRGPK